MIRILQLSDLHVFAEPDATLKGIPTRESLQHVIDWITQNEVAFDHVIVTGDHTHDEVPQSYRVVRQQLGRLTGDRWQVPGNHDDRTVLRQVFPEVNQQLRSVTAAGASPPAGDAPIQFSFQAGDWQCIGLDTHLPGQVPGVFDAEQEHWLKQMLQQSSTARVALFCHHPPIDVGSVWMDRIGLQQRERLQRIVADDERIRAIFCGHIHHDFEGRLHQAVVRAVPSTGIQFDPAGDTPQFAADAPGYRVIEFNGGNLATRIVRLPDNRYRPVQD